MIFPTVLSYTGTRKYIVDGHEVIVLRRPSQVQAPSHIRTFRLLTATDGHPKIEKNGEVYPVWLDIHGTGELDDLGCIHLPDTTFRVGQIGDDIEFKSINGYPMPHGFVSIKSVGCLDSILNGMTQTSLGYFSLRLPPPPEEMFEEYGIWEGPNGPEKYQLEQILDLEDPRLQSDYLIEQGIARNTQDAEKIRSRIGANHLAVNIPQGRGGPEVKIQLDENPIQIFDFGKSHSKTCPKLAFCFDALPSNFPIDNDVIMSDNAHNPLFTPILTNLMKLNFTTIFPQIARFFDEEELAPLPKTQVDIPEGLLEVFQNVEATIMGALTALKEKLGESEGGMKAAEEKAMQEAGKATMLEQANSALKTACDKLEAERDQAIEELAPIRKERTQKQIEEALRIGGIDLSKTASFDSVEDAKREVVYTKFPHLKEKKCSNDYIEARYHALLENFKDEKETSKESVKQSTFFAGHPKTSNGINANPRIDVGRFELEQILKACN